MTQKIPREIDSPLVQQIIEGLHNLKAENIVVLHLSHIDTAICDYFVVADGNSNTQVKAIAGAVEKQVREQLGDKPWHIEGMEYAEWVLLDYVTVAVHVFQKESREFYDLEGLWNDAEVYAVAN